MENKQCTIWKLIDQKKLIALITALKYIEMNKIASGEHAMANYKQSGYVYDM